MPGCKIAALTGPGPVRLLMAMVCRVGNLSEPVETPYWSSASLLGSFFYVQLMVMCIGDVRQLEQACSTEDDINREQ
jgi:hypothetical protein